MRCSVYIATSLDGFIARPDGAIDWLARVEQPGEDYGFAAFMASVDTLIVGRATYDTVRGFGAWPWAGKRVIVLSSRAFEPCADEQRFTGEPRELVEQLRSAGAQRAYVDGGVVIRSFLAADLIDDLTLSIIPIVLGRGIPLFGELPERELVLESSQAFERGLVQLRYRIARAGMPGQLLA